MRPLLILLSLVLAAQAEPLVVGFQRFHSAQPAATGGHLLYQELSCANCHGGTVEVPRRAPELPGLTQRLNAAWVEKFLADPAAARPGATMPHLLTAEESAPVLHYLASLKPKTPFKAKSLRHVNTARGRDLFHTQGCVACHTPGADFQPPEGMPKAEEFSYPSIAFPALGEKYTLASLADFIQNPLKTRPDARMPRFELEDQDAVDLAGYLLKFEGSDGSQAARLAPFKMEPALAARGKLLVRQRHCAACHTLPAEVAAQPVALQNPAAGCMAEKPAPGIPHYGLSTAQRSALAAFLPQRAAEPAPALRAQLTFEGLNCLACHDRDGRGGPDAARKAYFQGDHNLGDTGRYPPPLTGIGRKLQPQWFSEFLAGGHRLRSYVQVKMPVYGAATDKLVATSSAADAKPTEHPVPPGGDDAAGRKLLGTLGGLGCITCHQWAPRASLGIQALDISNLGHRLQPGWLREYLIDPAHYRPGTLMPSFWPGGKAANTEILGGETDKQIAAIISFAQSANGEPEGFPQTSGGEFELVPKDRPIVQRTFMESTGTHAILVGFPGGISLAYDGEHGHPSLAWQGKFFDAYNTWFSRFAPFEKPPGTAIISWPAPPVDAGQLRCNGYLLDEAGAPTFLLSLDGVLVRDHFSVKEGALIRTLTGDATALRRLPLTQPAGVTVSEAPVSGPGQRILVYSWK